METFIKGEDVLLKRSLERASGKLPSLTYPASEISNDIKDSFVETSFISAPGAEAVLEILKGEKNG